MSPFNAFIEEELVAARGDERHCIPPSKMLGDASPHPPAVDARELKA